MLEESELDACGIGADDIIEILRASHEEPRDLSHLEALRYHYRAGLDYVEVEGPLTLSVAEDGSHNILCADRVGMTLPPGWVLIESFAKFGHAPFAGHPVPSDMVTE